MKSTLIFLLLIPICVLSQKYTIDNSTVTFYSYAPIEDIKAESASLQGVVDFSSKEFFFRIPINSFVFPSSLMQQHFNESYLESHLFPLSVFKGTFDWLKAFVFIISLSSNPSGVGGISSILANGL